jgi:hypothetical protein
MRYPDLAAPDQRFAARGATVINTETTTSAGWTELPTYGPVVIMPAPPSGRVNVHLYAWVRNLSGGLALAGLLVTAEDNNAVAFSPTDDYSCAVTSGNHQASMAIIQLAELDSGRMYRYRMQYRSSGGTAEYLRRGLHVVPVLY